MQTPLLLSAIGRCLTPTRLRRGAAVLTAFLQITGFLAPSLTAYAAAASDVIITEVLVDPTAVADTHGEWVELYNTTGSLVNLAGWTLDDGTTTYNIVAGSIPANGYAVIGNDGTLGTNGGVAVDAVISAGAVEFLSDAGNFALTLKDNLANTISTVNIPATPTAGQAYARDQASAGVGTFHFESVNKFNGTDYGTPRSVNSPTQVTGVVATDGGADTVDVSWNAVTGATDYAIYRNGTLLTTTAALTISDDIDGTLNLAGVTLTADNTVAGQVTVSWNAGAVANSTVYSYTVAARTSGVTGAVSAANTGYVTPVISDYELFAIGAPDASVGTTGSGATLTKLNNGLGDNVAKTYKIRANSVDTGWSALSASSVSTATLSTNAPAPTVSATYSAGSGYTTTVTNYAPVGGFATVAIVETSGNAGGSGRSASADTAAFTDTGLSGGTQYCYQAVTYNSVGTAGVASASTCATTPPAQPGTLAGTPTAASTTSIDWSWTNVAAETGYNGYDTLAANKFSTAADTVTASEGALTANTAYSRYVAATNASGDGQVTSTTTKYTAQAAPTGVTFSAVGTNSLTATASGIFTNPTLGSSGLLLQESVTTTNSGWQQGTSWSLASLNPNTTYSFTAQARNGDAVTTATSGAATKTTLAETPAAPTVAPQTAGAVHSLAVTIALGNNPVATEYAILNTETNQYLQGTGAGTIGAAPVWKTKANWETGTINYYSNLSANTEYGFRLVARNLIDNTNTAAGAETRIYTNANAPVGAPTVVSPPTVENQLTVSVVDTSGNGATTEYALQETGTNNYVQANGTLAGAAYWTTKPNWQSINVTGLAANTSYAFQTKARNADAVETVFTAASGGVVTLAAAVTGATLTNTTDTADTKMSLTWTIGTASGTKIEQNSGAGYDTVICDNTCGASPYALTGKTPNTAYTYRISSYNSAGVLNTITLATSNTITTPPAAPAGLAETAGSTTTQVVWSWNASAGANTYNIYDNGNVLLTNTAATTWTHTPLGINTASTIYVRPLSAANGEGVKTATLTRYSDATIPVSLAGVANTATQITWSWLTTGNPLGTEFNATSDSTNTSGWIANAVSFVDTAGVAINTLYTISVTARNTDGDTTTPQTLARYSGVDVPTAPTFSGITTASITANTTVTNSATAEVSITNTTTPTVSGYLGNGVMSWSNGGLAPNTQYTYTATARNGDDLFVSAAGASASTYTLAATPAAPTVAVVAGSATSVTVDPASGAGNPAGTEYAIVVDTDGNGTDDTATSVNFVKADGTIGAVAWQTDAAWATQTVTGLTSNTTYRFAVKARNANNIETALGATTNVVTLAAAATGLTATPSYDAINLQNITLTYGLNGATNVRIHNLTTTTDVYTGNAASYTNANLAANTSYVYRIYSLNSVGAENSSFVTNSATTPPAAPTGLTASTSTNTTIDWSWNASAGAATYEIRNGGSNTLIASTAALTYTQTATGPNAVHSVYIVPVNAAPVSGAPSGTASGYSAANVPAGLTGTPTAASTTSIDWSWNVNGNPVGTQFSANDDAAPANTTGFVANAVSWVDNSGGPGTTPLTANTAYTLSVLAKNNGAPVSNTAAVTTTKYTAIQTPTTLNLVTKTATQIDVSNATAFSNLATGSSGLTFNRDGAGGGDQVLVTVPTFSFAGLTPDTTYNLKAKAQNGDGVATAFGSTLSVTTYAASPLAPTLGAATTTSFTVLPDASQNPAATVFAVAVDDDGDGVAWNTTNYLNAGGTVIGAPVYQNAATWATVTATGLITNKLHRVRTVAQNNNGALGVGAEATIYTLPAIPGAPTLALPAANNAVNVTIVDATGNYTANTTYAIAIDNDGNGVQFDTTNYVQAGGAVGGAPVYQTAAAWGTQTVTGLADNATTHFKTIAGSLANPATVSAAGAVSSIATHAAVVTGLASVNASTPLAYAIATNWTAGAQSGVRVSWSSNGGGAWTIVCDDVALPACTNPITASALTATTNYIFMVESYNSANVLNNFNTAQTGVITTPPAAPLGVTSPSQTTASATWQWNDVATAVSYNVYNATNDALIQNVLDDGTAGAQGFVQGGLSANQTYSIYVRAVNVLGQSVKSSAASAVTDAFAPAGLISNLAGLTTTAIRLDWNVNGNPAGTEFCANDNVTNESGAGCAATATGVAGTGWIADLVTWLNTGATAPLTPNTQYTFAVKARDTTFTHSATSNLAVFTAAEVPTVPTQTGSTTTSLSLATGGVTNPGSATFKFDDVATPANTSGYLGAGITAWTNGGLTPAKAYTYTSTARNGDNVATAASAASAVFYTLPAAPTFAATNTTANTFDITLGTNGNDPAALYSFAVIAAGLQYVQADGTLGAGIVWRTAAAWGATFTINTLNPNTAYSVIATAQNGAAQITSSGATVVTTLAAAPAVVENSAPAKAISVWYPATSTFRFQNTANAVDITKYHYTFDTLAPNVTVPTSANSWAVLGTDIVLAPTVTGQYYLHLTSYNAADVAGSSAVFGPYFFDADLPPAPTVTSPSHAALAWSNVTTIQVNLASADVGSGLANYRVILDQSAGTVPTTLTGTQVLAAALPYSFAPVVESGSGYYVHAIAVDTAGNVSGAATHFGPLFIDTTPPTAFAGLTLTNPINNANKTIVALSGTTEAAATVAYSIDDAANPGTAAITGSMVTGGGGAFAFANIDVTTLADSLLTASLTSTDAAGNTSVATVTATKDVAAPVITLTAPLAPVTINAATYTITGSTTEIATLNFSGGGSASTALVAPYTFSYVAPLILGANNFTVTATDTVGNTSGAIVVSTVTNTNTTPAAPAALAWNTAVANIVNVATLTLTGTAQALTTVNAVITSGATSLPFTGAVDAAGNFTLAADLSTLPDGAVTGTVTITDGAAQTSASTATPALTKAATAPTATAITTTGITTTGATISTTITDPDFDLTVPSVGTVTYDTVTPPAASTAALLSTGGTGYAATLAGLTPNTVYYFRINTTDDAANTATSAIGTFQTPLAAAAATGYAAATSTANLSFTGVTAPAAGGATNDIADVTLSSNPGGTVVSDSTGLGASVTIPQNRLITSVTNVTAGALTWDGVFLAPTSVTPASIVTGTPTIAGGTFTAADLIALFKIGAPTVGIRLNLDNTITVTLPATGATTSTLKVVRSEDGVAWTEVGTFTVVPGAPNTISFTTNTLSFFGLLPVPNAVTDLTATATGTTTASLAWTATTGATSYSIYRNATFVASTAGVAYTDTALAAGTAYAYTVYATSAAATSTISNTANITTTAAPVVASGGGGGGGSGSSNTATTVLISTSGSTTTTGAVQLTTSGGQAFPATTTITTGGSTTSGPVTATYPAGTQILNQYGNVIENSVVQPPLRSPLTVYRNTLTPPAEAASDTVIVNGNGFSTNTYSKPVTLTITLTPAELAAGANGFVAWNPTAGKWEPIATTFSADGKTARIMVHRGAFLLAVKVAHPLTQIEKPVKQPTLTTQDSRPTTQTTDWAAPFITTLHTRGLVSDTFDAAATTNRAELLTLALRTFIVPTTNANHTLVDVSADAWYAPAAETAVQLGIVAATPQRTIHPADAATRGAALAVILRAAQLPVPAVTASSFADVTADSWLAPYTEYALANGIIAPGTTFNPNGALNKGALAKLLVKTLEVSDAYTGPRAVFPGHVATPTDGQITLTLTTADLTPFTASLRAGDTHAEVVQLKKLLAVLGYYQSLEFGETFTAQLAASVLQFQMQSGILVNSRTRGAGTLGTVTRRELNKVLATIQPASSYRVPTNPQPLTLFSHTFVPGDQDPEISRLKAILRRLGYEAGDNSELFTPGLSAALTQFQLDKIVILDSHWQGAGTFGPATQRRLNDLMLKLK